MTRAVISTDRQTADRVPGALLLLALGFGLFELTAWMVQAPGILDVLLASLPRLAGVRVSPTPDRGVPVTALLTVMASLLPREGAALVRRALVAWPWLSGRLPWLLARLRLLQLCGVATLSVAVLVFLTSVASGVVFGEEPLVRALVWLGGGVNATVCRLLLFNLPMPTTWASREADASLRSGSSVTRGPGVAPSHDVQLRLRSFDPETDE